jgi:hypothetical protein
MTDPQERLVFNQVTLDKIRVGVQRRVSPVMLHDLTVSAREDFFTRDMLLSMEAFVLGKQQRSEPETSTYTVEFTKPASWWQQFKQSAIRDGNPFFDPAKVRTVKERRQVQAVVTHHRAHVWPEFNIVLPPDAGKSVVMPLPVSVDWRDLPR